MRNYFSVRIASLLSLFSIIKHLSVKVFRFFYRLVFFNCFLKNNSAFCNTFTSFFNLDMFFLKPVRQYFLIDYFSVLYYNMYSCIKYRFRNNRRRKLSL